MRHSAIRPVHAFGGGRGVQAFAPGRVNLIGEHTDYNDGLCLPFAVERGVTVRAEPRARGGVEAPERARHFARGAVAELRGAGMDVRPCRLEISSDLPSGAGLSSSAALCVSLCLALCAVSGAEAPEAVALARLCSRVENDWVGVQTGLLDQLASLCAEPGHALRIDMRGPRLHPVALRLDGHVLAVLDSGATRSLAGSGYDERREECRAACAALGVSSLRDARSEAGLPAPLDRRVRHVLSENGRVDAAVAALEAGDPRELGRLLDASHRSLRDDYEVSVPAVERAVERCRGAGAVGARIMGGGFGGSVLALFEAGSKLPEGAITVEAGPGARVL